MLILAGLATKPRARAIIASTYIRQLRSGLPRCCLHGRSRRRDGAHLLNGILASANLRCGHTATHPTCPTHPTGVVGTQRRKGRYLRRNQTLLEIMPEGNGELASSTEMAARLDDDGSRLGDVNSKHFEEHRVADEGCCLHRQLKASSFVINSMALSAGAGPVGSWSTDLRALCPSSTFGALRLPSP